MAEGNGNGKHPAKNGSSGRPSLYQPSFADQAFKFCLLGATDDDLAEFFEVARQTIVNWKEAHPEFLDALKRGKLEANANVADSLYQRSLGYTWTEEQAIKLKDVEYSDGKRVRETERVEIVEVTRLVPPDPVSMIFWLKNRRPDLWRDKQEAGSDVRDRLLATIQMIQSRDSWDRDDLIKGLEPLWS